MNEIVDYIINDLSCIRLHKKALLMLILKEVLTQPEKEWLVKKIEKFFER